VRGRTYFADDLWKGPALNKTPLVLWQPHYAFLKCAHELWPASVNGGAPAPGVPHGVLLHFKFLSDLTEKLAAETVRQQHTSEYDAYSRKGRLEDDCPNFMSPRSRKYDGWRSLHEAGLLDGVDRLDPKIAQPKTQQSQAPSTHPTSMPAFRWLSSARDRVRRMLRPPRRIKSM
jgi:hypothetical protein